MGVVEVVPVDQAEGFLVTASTEARCCCWLVAVVVEWFEVSKRSKMCNESETHHGFITRGPLVEQSKDQEGLYTRREIKYGGNREG